MEINVQYHDFIGENGLVERFLYLGDTGITGMAKQRPTGDWEWYVCDEHRALVGADTTTSWEEVARGIRDAVTQERDERIDHLVRPAPIS